MNPALYLHILLESAWVASIIPLGSDPTFFAMKAFGGYPMLPAFFLAVAGATAGQSFNWWLGRLALGAKPGVSLAATHRNYARISAAFRKYGLFLLLFSWVPLGNFIVLSAGFLGTRYRLVLPLVIAGQIYHYGRYLL